MEINDFVWKFYNLPGKTLPEKQKNINTLLKETPSDHDALLAVITPKTPFENLFKLKILLKLQRVPELVQILKYEEEYLPARLLRNKWFCQKLASILDENSSDFVSAVLPLTSYVIRKRIITKLATYGSKLDGVFDEVYARYGIYIAKDLLVGCTPAKIEEVLKNQKVVLSPYCQKLLYQKHPQVFGLYVTQEQGRNIDESVVNYVARQDMNNFLELLEKFNGLDAHLGKRLTKKMLSEYKELLIEKADIFSCILHLKTVCRILNEEDLKLFFVKCSPPNVDALRFGSVGFRNMRKALGKQYYKFLAELLKEKYKKSIYDFSDLVDDELMEIMDVEEREKWISIKKKKGIPEDDLIPFMKISDSIPLIKNKINVTSSVHSRESLIALLVKSCKVNNDFKALAEVAEYVCSRHRNDDTNVLRHFIYQLELLFPFDKFDDKLWEAVNSVMDILNRKGDHSLFKYEFYVKYAEFLFKQNKLTDERLFDFLKRVKSAQRFKYHTNIEELRKLLLLKSVDLIPKLLEKDERVEFEDLRMIIFILQWNKDHPQDKISILDFPRLVATLKKSTKLAIESDALNPDISILSIIFEYIICSKEESDLRNETIKNYFLVTSPYYCRKIDIWLLKHQPEVIYANVESFLEHLFYCYSLDLNLLNYMKIYTDISFLEKVIKFCLNSIEQDKYIDAVFHILAALEPPNKFLEHIVPYYPTQDEIGEDPESVRKGTIALSIAQGFKCASTPVLPAVIQYCKGDFKNAALQSLYYLFYHSPENQLSVFINELSSKSVSVRKHAIFLTAAVGSVEEVKKLLKHFIENEKNVSVQKHLFTATLKYFIKNPSDEFWEFVKICITKLDKNDSESYNILANLHLIPEKYQARYVIFVWEILKKSEDLEKNRPRLLSKIPLSLFQDFQLDFLLEVISENFLKSGSSCENAIKNFVVSALTKSNFRNEVMDATFDIIGRFKNTKCDTLGEEKIARDLLSCFVSSLVYTFATKEENYEILTNFAQRWHTLFSPTEAMREHLRLSFTQFYLESGKDLVKFGSVVAEFLENLVSTYGVVIVDCFAAELKDSLKTFLKCYDEFNEDFFNFSLSILKNWNSLVFYLLAIKLLPPKQPSGDKAAELFQQIIQILRQVSQESIQVLMNLYVMDME